VKVIAGAGDRGPVVSAAVALSALAVLVLTVPLGLPVFEMSLAVAAIGLAALWYRTLLRWPVLLAVTILVIFFVPIKRYTLPGSLPFDLEPYRLIVTVVIAGWLASLLIDPRVRLRRSGLEAPALLVLFAAVASVVVNPGRVSSLGVQDEVVKGITFLASYFLLFYLVVGVVRTRPQVELLVKVLVAGGAVVAFFGVIESRTGYNIFEHLGNVLPFLKDGEIRTGEIDTRGGNLRVYGSSQSPIALGAAFDMLIPLAIYLAWQTRRWPWAVAGILLTIGSLATLTRTSVVMLIPLALVFLWLRPSQTRRLWPLLIPVVCAAYFAVPGTIGTIRGAFFPEGGLIAEQSRHAGAGGSGRIADLDPALEEWESRPVLGQGFATRQTGRENRQNHILDNQWLKTLLETGVVGAFAWFWLFARFTRRLGREAKCDLGERGFLLVALTASVVAFAVGMFFYDAFSFIQVTFLLFFLLALGAALLQLPEARAPARPRPPVQTVVEART
jgi:polysaccharide biosynthesis protein PslJ